MAETVGGGTTGGGVSGSQGAEGSDDVGTTGGVPAQRPAPETPWLCTGLHWREGRPALVSVGPDGTERIRTLIPGGPLRLRWSGPRRCVGWYAPKTGRTACPDAAEVSPAATLAQCPLCQNRDHGLAVARDRITDDGRTYQLYLAWFAPGMLKVGISAESRGVARLLEQGAIGYTVLATGTLPAARRAELTLSRSGLARERFRADAKVEAWWRLPDRLALTSGLTAARATALRTLADHDLTRFPDGEIVDQHAFFALADGAPAAYQEVASLAETGQVAAVTGPVVGKHLFLTGLPGGRPVLLDLRLVAGRPVTEVETGEAAAGHPTAPAATGLHLVERRRPVEYDMESLF